MSRNEEVKAGLKGLLLPALVLLLFVATQYPHALKLPFVNDDYFLLDRTQGASFASLWKRHDLLFGWYRPWSRELHYWALQHLFGTAELGYHLVSIGLWLGLMLLYWTWARRCAGIAAASVATSGLASLALWGGPLLWVAGAQDLWALLFSLAYLHFLARGRAIRALAMLALALLSKESAAVLPGVGTAYLVLIERRRAWDAISRIAPSWLVTVAWAATHPVLRERFFGPLQSSLETAHRLSPGLTVARTLLAQINLDSWPKPGVYSITALVLGAVGAGILSVLVWRSAVAGNPTSNSVKPRRVIAFGLLWAAAGWSILLLPSIGWHPYYGVMGSLGVWLALGVALAPRVRLAVAAVAVLAVLRSAEAYTPSWDWGSEWYQRRAGNILGAIRGELTRQHPSFPAHSRVFFVHVPNNIGLLAGDGPSLRVWYGDSTLRGGYYSQFTPRSDGLTERDFFFRFDSTAGLIDVHRGREDLTQARRANPAWEDDHEILAAVFLRAGDVHGAAEEYAKLAHLPWRMDCVVYAGACWTMIGDSAAAESCNRVIASRMHYSLGAVRDSVGILSGIMLRDLKR